MTKPKTAKEVLIKMIKDIGIFAGCPSEYGLKNSINCSAGDCVDNVNKVICCNCILNAIKDLK